MIVCKIFFCFLCLFQHLNLLKTDVFRLEVTLSFYKNVLKQTLKFFNTKFWAQWKGQKSSYQIRQILALFCSLNALILDWNSMSGLRVTKIVKEIKFKGVWGELESKKGFQRKPFTKYLRLTLVFRWNSALPEKFNFYFSRVFC